MSSSTLYTTANECPLIVFDRVASSGDVTFLSKTGAHTVDECKAAWEAINQQIFEIVGISAKQAENLAEKISALEALYAGLIEGDAVQRTIAKSMLINLASDSAQKPTDIWKICALLSQKLKFQLNPNSITVREYITYLNL